MLSFASIRKLVRLVNSVVPRLFNDAGLRSRSRCECSRQYAPGRPGTGKASRGDRFPCHAVWRTDALPDRLGVRKSDTSSDVAPRIWPVGSEEMSGKISLAAERARTES